MRGSRNARVVCAASLPPPPTDATGVNPHGPHADAVDYQDCPYKSPKWFKMYSQRDQIEAFNKDVKANGLSDTKRRRVRGLPKQGILAAMFAATASPSATRTSHHPTSSPRKRRPPNQTATTASGPEKAGQADHDTPKPYTHFCL